MEIQQLIIEWLFALLPFFLIGMAAQEPIERLFVTLEADVREFIDKGEKAIKRLEKGLDRVDKKGKEVGSFKKFKAGLDGVIKKVKQAQLALIAFAAAIVAVFKAAQQAVSDLRIERSFFRLASGAQQSGNDILAAMKKASRGAVDDLTLMQQANLAMQLGVAKTPEEFEKLTRSAIALGAAVGRGPVEAINDLVVAAGRRSRLVLDNLGLSLGEVNMLMDEFAQQDFGKTVDQLDQIQRDMLFTRATIEAANRKAGQLGGNLEDAGTGVEQIAADMENFRGEMNQTALVLVTLLNDLGEGEGLLKRLTRGAVEWQSIMIAIVALVRAANDTLTETLGKTTKLAELLSIEGLGKAGIGLGRELGRRLLEGEELAQIGEEAGETFTDSFQRNFEELREQFIDVLDPEAAAAAAGAIQAPAVSTEVVEEGAEKTKDILRDLTTDMLNAADERQAALEKSEEDHVERMAQIAEGGARKRKEIDRELQDELVNLGEDTAKEREGIITDATRELAELAEDTDRELSEERDEFQNEERRDTEDHLREMRRLTQDHLLALGDAVKNRDARAVVDLQRRFEAEQRNREEDFSTRQSREREDASESLRKVRDDEARRRQEITAARAEELRELAQNEGERRAEIGRSHAEQIRKLEENLVQARAKEAQSFQERQAELDGALNERLQAIAKELADEEGLNEASAWRLLRILNEHFGAGGDIDKLMDDFIARRSQRMVIDIGFEEAGRPTASSLGARGRRPRARGGFQRGGSVVARQPTTALFGEAGPELATFIPLRKMGGMEMETPPQRLDVVFSGTAPPGIRSGERDQIAGVILSALRDTGQLQR